MPRTKKLGKGAAHGVLAGIQFLLRDQLVGPLSGVVIALNFLAAGLSATLPYYAYESFSGNSKVAGLFFTSIGAGALLGSIGAAVVVKRVQPLRLAAFGIVAMTLPLWLLPLDLPAWGVMATLFTALLFTPLVNGPVIGVITARTPPRSAAEDDDGADLAEHARRAPRLPRRRAAARAVGRLRVFAAVAIGMTATALVFAAIALRYSNEVAPETPAVPA